MTCDDLFIAVELSSCCEERAEEGKKKVALQLIDVEEQALAIQQQGKSALSLNVTELDMLLT